MAGNLENEMVKELEALPMMVRAYFPASFKKILIELARENDRLRADYAFIRSQTVGENHVSKLPIGPGQ